MHSCLIASYHWLGILFFNVFYIVYFESPAQPVTFKQKLGSQEAEEGASVTLHCELSKPGVPVEWRKGTQVLKSGEKYQMKQKESVSELLIRKVVPEDSGDYSCVCGDQKTTASLKIKGVIFVVLY
uniref:Ig-like domain-containing protein n=1 Tax=Hucho hucho TaxID=62062 RepID=A0A4W5N9S7_9TELE